MNPTSNTTPTNQPKPRDPIYSSYIQPFSLFHLMIRMSVKLKILSIWRPTSSSTNNFLRSYNSHHPSISTTNKRLILPTNTYLYTRTYMTTSPGLTYSYNMIYLNSSRNKPSPFRPNRRRIRISLRI